MTGSVHSVMPLLAAASSGRALHASASGAQAAALTSLHATGIQDAAWLLLALPLTGAAILLLGGKRTNSFGHLIGVAMPVLAFGYAVAAFVQMLGYPAAQRSRELVIYQFINVGRFQIPLGLRLDQLSICFVLLITGVGSLIFIFAVGYMANDPERRRFFGYMNLFLAAMLLLVLGSNYLVLYAGWEGVGLASYLLIGFWQYKPTAATAAKKAFIANRVGDVGLSVAIMLMFAQFGSVTFTGVFGAVGSASHGVVTALGFLLLLGACGKSAQVPLQSWLLDAMEGPTPVSALIHAATMVTAGVYLLVRSNPILALTPDARIAIAVVGTITLLFGGIIACAKDDIKKSLAGSTMSQIGYMFLGAGLGPAGYVFAIALLLAHGFYKAGLFTKDPIIDADFTEHGTGGWILGICALIGAGITAFYMTRMMLMTWQGKQRWSENAHPHESPPVMTWPMIVLAIGSVGAGAFLIINDRLQDFLAPVVGVPPTSHGFVTVGGAVALVLALVGVGLAWVIYGRVPVPATAPAGRPLTVAARKDLYGDAFNESVLMRPGQWLTRLSVYFDNRGVDGLVNSLAALVGGTSGRWRRLQTGFVRSYALSMIFGAAVLVALLLAVRL